MAVGDGMADLVGRRFGKHKWRKGGEKSVEGSVAFASGSFLVSMAMIQWFHRFGILSVCTIFFIFFSGADPPTTDTDGCF